MTEMSKKNIAIMLCYLAILTVVLAGYLFMVAFRTEGYDPGVYKKGYLYFITFQLLLFSLLAPFWTGGQSIEQAKPLLQGKSPWSTVFRYYGGLLWQIIVFSFASIPLILIIFMAGRLNHMSFLWLLLIQVLWGTFILSVRGFLATTNLHKTWQDLLLVLLIFTLLVLTLVFFYFYVEYGRLVITTVYDGDIPRLFFLNPLLTTAGLLYVQTGGSNQLGWAPVLCYAAFYCPATLIAWLLTARNLSRSIP